MLSLNILKSFITELESTQPLTIIPQHSLNLCKKSLENLSKKLLPDHFLRTSVGKNKRSHRSRELISSGKKGTSLLAQI